MTKVIERAVGLRLWGQAHREQKGYNWIVAQLGEGYNKKDVARFAGDCRRSFIPLPSLRGAERAKAAKQKEVSVEDLQILADELGITVEELQGRREQMMQEAAEKKAAEKEE